MQRQIFFPILAFLLVTYDLSLGIQMANRGRGLGNLQVRLTDINDRPIGIQAHVQLVLSGGGGPFAEGYSNNEGMISFSSIPVGNYHLVISGDGVDRTDTGSFLVDERKSTQSIFVRVKRTSETEAERSEKGGVVGVQNINVPPAANKEFEAAGADMAQRDWKAAVTHLNRAIAIYPNFVAAYNNLGTAYLRMGDLARERQALEKAIRLDDRFAPSLLNLGLLSIVEKKYSDAEDFLGRAATIEPANPQVLMLLAESQLLAGHYDQAVASKARIHDTPHHEKYAKAHYIAARALEHEGRAQEAADELRAFLAEQPEGPLAEVVRRELGNLRNAASSAPHARP
jgi:tetratricopeptide (TPR) repeat protein